MIIQTVAMQENSNLLQQSRLINEEAWISDLDPMLEGGLKILHQQALVLEIRETDQEGVQVVINDVLWIRIIGDQQEGYNLLKLQLSSESNLFRVYVCQLDEKRFERLRKQQALNFGFSNLLGMLIKQLMLTAQEGQKYKAVLDLGQITAHKLKLIENIEYKRIELISLDFQMIEHEELKRYVSYRFAKMKAKDIIIQERIKCILGMVKLKNRNLLSTIDKTRKNPKDNHAFTLS